MERCFALGTATNSIEPFFRSAQPHLLGYALRVRGNVGSEAREFLVGVGKGAHAKHHFRPGDMVSGSALPVVDPRMETVEFYKVSDLKVTERKLVEETQSRQIRSLIPDLAKT